MEKMAHFFSSKASKMGRLRPPHVILGLILLFASFLRLYKIEQYMTFLGDEGRDMLAMFGILHGQLTLLGPASSVGGFFLGPIYYYFAAPFLFLFHYNPVGPSVMVALFGVATVFLVYKIGREFFNERAGLIAAFLYAISPVVITYSRSSWNPNIVPFFSITTLYLLYKGVSKKNIVLLLASGFSFGILMQLHYLASFIGVVMFLYLLSTAFVGGVATVVHRAKSFFANSIFVFLGFVVGFLPFILFELRHSFLNTTKIFNFILKSEETGVGTSLISQVWHVFERLFPGIVGGYPLPSHYFEYPKEFLILWFILSVAVGSLAVCFFIYCAVKKGLVRNDSMLLLVWLLVPVALFGLYRKDIYDYYLGIIFPLPFLLVGNFLSRLWEARFRGISPNFYKVLAIFLLGFFAYTSLQKTPIKVGENQQVKQARDASQLVMDLAGDRPYNFGIVSGGNSDFAYRYFFKLAGKEPVTIENPQVDPERKTITDQLIIVCELSESECHPLGNPAWEIAGFGRAEIDGVWKSSVLTIMRLVHLKENR